MAGKDGGVKARTQRVGADRVSGYGSVEQREYAVHDLAQQPDYCYAIPETEAWMVILQAGLLSENRAPIAVGRIARESMAVMAEVSTTQTAWH